MLIPCVLDLMIEQSPADIETLNVGGLLKLSLWFELSSFGEKFDWILQPE